MLTSNRARSVSHHAYGVVTDENGYGYGTSHGNQAGGIRRRGQAGRLPVTTSSVITEAPRNILGLNNYGIFFVFGAFVLVIVMTDYFPAAIVAATATYTFIRFYIDTKPRYFVRHLMEYMLRNPRKLSHRPKPRGIIFADDNASEI